MEISGSRVSGFGVDSWTRGSPHRNLMVLDGERVSQRVAGRIWFRTWVVVQV